MSEPDTVEAALREIEERHKGVGAISLVGAASGGLCCSGCNLLAAWPCDAERLRRFAAKVLDETSGWSESPWIEGWLLAALRGEEK